MDADQRQIRHLGVFCPLGPGQAGVPPDLTRLLQTQAQTMSLYFSKYLLPQEYFLYVACKVSEGLAGFGYENPHTT